MEVGLVHKIDIDREMQQAYLDYAMSVIVSRALPDARDGLKPVHRRILYAMHELLLRPDSAYKKSARIVGEVLGKYHPHGDLAVYEAMARMAQDFSMRYLLVDGQGNFGSVDGDPPAAMRYTEARLTDASVHMLTDIAKDTVNFTPNFDGTLAEPAVLPAALPNLLVNGATGIAVGMATSIPPHNLAEVVDALHYLIQNWEKLDDIGVEDLLKFVKGPDFPTGGVILHSAEGDGLVTAYSTGRGQITVQASAHLEEMERGRNRIIVSELPYMTNKASLIERIAELARETRIEGIVDLRDESDRQGMRIVIELSKTADPDSVLRDLYKHTPMQSTFSINMLALVDGEPRTLSLKQALRVFVEHRLEVVRRRSLFELEKARQRAHILEGLRIALKYLDEVISIIRKAPDVETARMRLIKRFKLTEIQAQAILDMQLRRLAALERKKIEDEYKEVVALIKQLEALLKSPKKMREVVSEELQAVKETYGDRRRTHIVQLKEGETKSSLLTKAELVAEKEIWVSVSMDGLISRTTDDKLPRISGKEAPGWLLKVSSRDTLYLVDEQGVASAIPVHALPETDDSFQGLLFWKASPLSEGVTLAGLFALPSRSSRIEGDPLWENRFILTATLQGMVKKSVLSELPGASANSFTLVKVNDGDRLGWMQITNGQNEILLVSQSGMAIRFKEEEVRPMGLAAAGVMGIKLAQKDLLAGMEILPKPGDILLLTINGKAKRLASDQFPRQGRYGQGVSAWKLVSGEKIVGLAAGKAAAQATIHTNKLLPKSIRFDEAPLQGRPARGQTIYELKPGYQVTRLNTPLGMVFTDQPKPAIKKSRQPKGVTATQPSLFDHGRPPAKAAAANNAGGDKKTTRSKQVVADKKASPAKKPATAKNAPVQKPTRGKPDKPPAAQARKQPPGPTPATKKVVAKRKPNLATESIPVPSTRTGTKRITPPQKATSTVIKPKAAQNAGTKPTKKAGMSSAKKSEAGTEKKTATSALKKPLASAKSKAKTGLTQKPKPSPVTKTKQRPSQKASTTPTVKTKLKPKVQPPKQK
jgi:DNA gyrase subunit A